MHFIMKLLEAIVTSVLKTQEGTESFYMEAEIRIIDVSDSTRRMRGHG